MHPMLIIAGGIVLLFVVLLTYAHFKAKNMPEAKKSENIKVLNAKNFKAQTRSGIVLVDFWAAWCGPCKMLTPVLNDIADNNKDNIKVAKLNVDQYKQVAAKMKIRNLPTMILFKDGAEIKRINGFKNKKALMKEITPYI